MVTYISDFCQPVYRAAILDSSTVPRTSLHRSNQTFIWESHLARILRSLTQFYLSESHSYRSNEPYDLHIRSLSVYITDYHENIFLLIISNDLLR
jgi:hypothetical protein